MEEKEGKINLPIPQKHPHILGQCVLTNNSFNFFGGIVTENPNLEEQSELNTNIHNGTIYSFSILSPDQIYETNLNSKYTEIIGASTVYNEEVSMSFTFGGLSLSKKSELLTSSDIYACRWINTTLDEKDQKIFFDPASNYAPKKQLVDKLRCPVDSAYNYMECSNVLNLHVRKHIYTPELTTQKPSPRCFHSAAWDTVNNLMWVFGGASVTQKGKKVYLNDLWTWSLYTGMWEQIEAQNPPTPRIGSSMTYINGRLYLFGGCVSTDDLSPLESQSKDNYFYYLDISRRDFTDLTWIPITNIPSELQHKLYGSTIVTYSPTDFQTYIIFTGGSLTNIYNSIPSLVETDRNSSRHEIMTIASYCIQTQQFNVFSDILSIPNVSYHSAAVSKNGTLFIAGGITAREGYDDLMFSRFLRTFDLKKYLSLASHSASSFDRTILFDVSELDADRAKSGREIDSELYADFLSAVKNEIEAASSSERVQQLRDDFLRHQTQHAPIEDFVVGCGGVFASVAVMKCRIGRPFLPSKRIGARLTRDLVTYAYTDTVEMARDSSDYDFGSLRTLLTFCRQRRLHRLIVFEVASNIHLMTAQDFIEICTDTSGGFDSKPLFADDSMASLKTVFARVLPRFHHLADFSKIGQLEPMKARELLQIVSGRHRARTSFEMPRSTLTSDLRFFDGGGTIETLDGKISCDMSSLCYDESDLSRAKYEVVRAVTSCSFGRLFDAGDADDIFAAFWLISRHKGEIDSPSLLHMLGDAAASFASFSRGNAEFKRRLVELLPQIGHFAVLEFAVALIGTGGLTEIVSDDDHHFTYDGEIGPPLPRGEIKVKIDYKPLTAYLTVLYNSKKVTDGSSVSSLIPPVFDQHELSDDFLSLFASNFVVSPCEVRNAVGDFIVREIFECDEQDEKRFLSLFKRLFDAELHEKAVARLAARGSAKTSPARRRGGGGRHKTFDASRLPQIAAADSSYIDSLSQEQINWLIEKSDRVAGRHSYEDDDDDADDDSEDEEENEETFSVLSK